MAKDCKRHYTTKAGREGRERTQACAVRLTEKDCTIESDKLSIKVCTHMREFSQAPDVGLSRARSRSRSKERETHDEGPS